MGVDFQKPTGTQDLLPDVTEKWRIVEKKVHNLCKRFHYREVRTPIFEKTDLFARGVGDTTDIVEKEMYTFSDKGKRSLTLRPEGTAGVVRAYVENKVYGQPDVTKWYYMGPMFRYERPQAGRQRQFHQFGVEAIGAIHPGIDAEVIALAYQFCVEAGLQNVQVEINSVGNSYSRVAYREHLVQFLLPIKGQLCADCRSRLERNPLRILDCKVDQHHFVNAPSIIDHLDEECQTHFAQVKHYLNQMNVPYQINHRMVRGLDYYTLTAFELKAQGIGAIDTIGGGGRYNRLIGDLGGPDEPGIGFGIGLERVHLILAHQNSELPTVEPLDVYMIPLGQAAECEVTVQLYKLRQAGIRADRDYLMRGMKAQMKSAHRFQARFTAILGDNELLNRQITVKNMGTGEQHLLDLEHWIMHIKQTKYS